MRTQQGLTLPELLIGAALIGVLAGLAIPAVKGVIEQTKARTVSDRFEAELAFARSEAVLRRRQVVVCRTRDFERCLDWGAWSAGAMTFEDRNYDRDLSPGETVLRVQQEKDFNGLHMVGNANRPVIGFRPDGRSAGSSTTLRICAKSLAALRLLVINTGGRTRTTPAGRDTPACGSDWKANGA
ncbi:GspH/FimT family pseudopilin [Silanimonas sp.]|jgi:type IV fimbrial biogenesis protein FimT|uniref:GspH/FimT family pseudopilin n=1 Tax=Silanimonas sp. TaxID=1929290 RepID=UPI0022BA7349|nr:GspH/FimT family pseudopilin [Silanimonas sp.]MCZ8114936.1 GspH/FimT family pseudopilin [Silanimonas sp.]